MKKVVFICMASSTWQHSLHQNWMFFFSFPSILHLPEQLGFYIVTFQNSKHLSEGQIGCNSNYYYGQSVNWIKGQRQKCS